jgi:acylphosphatase
MIARHLLISGRVQGVGYRYRMTEAAGELGITGWVRNRRDGTVEAVVAGEEAAVDRMIAWARRGPRSAAVTDVTVTETTGTYDGFELLPTV